MNKKDVYVVSLLNIYEHNMGTYSTLTAPMVCLSIEEAQKAMKTLAKEKMVNELDFEMDGNSEEAVLNRKRFEQVFENPEADMMFDVMWFPHPDINDVWDNRFVIKILPSTIDN